MLFVYRHLTGHAEEMQQKSQGKRSSGRKRVAGIITHLSIFKTCPCVINTLHPSCIEWVQNIEISPDDKLTTKLYNKLQLLTRLSTITGFTSLVPL